MDHDRLFESLPAYVLGALTDEERIEVEDHMDACPVCASEYGDLAEAGTILALNVPPREPPRRLRQRVMDSVDREIQEPLYVGATRKSRPVRPGRIAVAGGWAYRNRFKSTAVAAVVAVAVATSAAVLVSNNTLDDRVNVLEAQAATEATAVSAITAEVMPDAVVEAATDSTVAAVSLLADANERLQQMLRESVQLQRTAAAPQSRTAFLESSDGSDEAVGTLVARSSSSGQAVLLIQGLEPSPPGYVYQLWLDIAGIPRSVVTFHVDQMGNALIQLPFLFFPATPAGGVTLEPSGGSQQPTGVQVLKLSSP